MHYPEPEYEQIGVEVLGHYADGKANPYVNHLSYGPAPAGAPTRPIYRRIEKPTEE